MARARSHLVSVRFCLAVLLACCALCQAQTRRQTLNGTYVATAYAQKGITASGEYVHRHVVAADPDVLPLGTRIKVRHAGRYSGEYVVADTGDKIVGRRLDIYLPSEIACKKFGVKRVRVRVIQLGDNTRASTQQATQQVKQDVQKDLQKNTVGNAATEADWAATHPASKTATKSTTTSTTTTTTSTTATSPDH